VGESLISLIVTTALLLGSPGPATLALAATGATVGFRRGSAFLAGILVGLCVAIAGAAIGIASFLAKFGQLKIIMQVIGALYIIYIAIKIATSPVIDQTSSNAAQAPKFRDGFILNLLNVKAYAAFFAIFSGFLLPLDNAATSYFFTGLVCILVATFVDVIWLWFGSAISPFFSKPCEARILRVIFAVLMILAVAFVLTELY